MFGTLLKKRLSSNQFANIFINVIFDTTEKGFASISDIINNDKAFVHSPSIDSDNFEAFQMIILAANYNNLDKFFEPQDIKEIKDHIVEKLSKIYNVEPKKIIDAINHHYSFIRRVNHPSKNLVYGISKAIFFKYKLNDFQDEYFSRMQAPNPLFLKRLDNISANFIWDWEAFLKKYRV